MADTGRTCASCGNENPAEARFCFSCGAPLESVAPIAESRKTVTVLFCDLVGSTAMGEQMDPETLRGLLTRSFDQVATIVERHGGVVEKFIGDAAMAVFGIPRVHEDDALRAVRAAADIREALANVAAASATVAWRTGIATGEVVAGDATGGQRLVTGDAVNVAARLQQTAQPGEILITAETQRLVRDAVEVEPIGELSVKGRQAPIEGYRLLTVDRSAAGHERRLDSPMVGRERPRRQLEEAFSEARDDRICHLFTILGAAGVGKSRLVNEFIASLGDDAVVVHGRCLSYGEGITYWPIAEVVRQAAGIGKVGGDPEADIARIAGTLPTSPDQDRIAELIGQAIGLKRGEASQDETPWAIRSFLEAMAVEHPLVVVLDDLQWAQPPLLDLVENLADWSHDAPILLIVLARRELLDIRPAWGGGKRAATTISLEPLSADETAQLIDNLLGEADLPTTTFDRVRAAAEGNPLFVEELLEMLIDDGALARVQGGGWTSGRDLAGLDIPPTIQALLAARLDGLAGPERAVLERGAVEGAVFHRDAVAALTPDDLRESVGPSLQMLTRREFVAPDRAELVGREAFRFRHQLIRDAAYQAIAKQSRAELHERFADWLEEALGDRVDEYRPILAYHLEEASGYRRELDPADRRLPELEHRAMHHLGEAGIAALNRGDMVGAYSLLGQVVRLSPDDRSALPWRVLVGEALIRATTAEEANRLLIQTREVADAVGDRRAAALAEVFRLHVRVSMTESTEAIARDADRLGRELAELGDDVGAMRARLELAKTRFWHGHSQDGIDICRALLATGTGPSRLVAEVRGWISAFAYWGPTPVPEGVAMLEELEAADQSGSRFLSVRLSRHRAAMLAQLGEFAASRAAFDAARELTRDLGDQLLIASLDGHFAGPSALLEGDAERAAELGRKSYEALNALGHRAFANTSGAHFARALVELGRLDEAERVVTEVLGSSSGDDPAADGPAVGAGALIRVRRGDVSGALEWGRRAVVIWDGLDQLDQVADAHSDHAAALELAGRASDALEELRTSLELFERKGHLVGTRRMRRRMAELGAGTS